MRCPYCYHTNNRVLDSRLTPDSENIRRRRECDKCKKRFTTYERIEISDITVVKKDGRRESFSRDKLLKGLLRACEKRPIKRHKIEAIASKIETALRHFDKDEIKSRKIGEALMVELAKLDDVAYVRFASVYKKFRDTEQFVDTIKTLKKKSAEVSETRNPILSTAKKLEKNKLVKSEVKL